MIITSYSNGFNNINKSDISISSGGLNKSIEVADCASNLSKALNSAYVWYKVTLPNGDWIITPNTPSAGGGSSIRNSLENTINLYEKSIEEALNEGVKQKLISEETKKQFQKIKQINSQYPGIRMVDSSTIDFDHPEGTIDEIRQWFSEWANNTVANKIDRRTENVIARGIQYRNVA